MARALLDSVDAAMRGDGRAPWLVLAWGNDSRGDDALGPMLAGALLEEGWRADPAVEVLVEMQLQVEHVLDLTERAGVLLVDASKAVTQARISNLYPRPGANLFSHALRPEALLQAYRQVLAAEPPPAWLLELPATHMELGAGLTDPARLALATGLALAHAWLRQRRGLHPLPHGSPRDPAAARQLLPPDPPGGRASEAPVASRPTP